MTTQTTDNVVNLSDDRKSDPLDTVTQFVRDYPGVAIAGGVAVGLIAGAILAPKTRRRLTDGAIALAEAAGTAGLALGRQALDRAEDAGASLRKQGDAVAHKAEDAADSVSDAAHRLLRKAIELGQKARS